MKVGFGQVTITPPAGWTIPGGFFDSKAEGIHDDLHVKAVVLTDARPAAIAVCDSLSISRSTVVRARKIAAERTGISPSNIMVCATHTHTGGPVANALGSKADGRYLEMLVHQIATAISEAKRASVEAQVGFGRGEVNGVSHNRRFMMRDGFVATHPGKMNPDIVAPAGPVDASLGVMGVKSVDGTFMGALVNYSMHCTVMGGSLYSADYPYYLSETIRRAFGNGPVTIFLNGACGDVTQVNNLDPRPPEFGEGWARAIGTVLGGEALKVLAGIDYVGDDEVRVESSTLRIPLRDIGEGEREWAKAMLDGECSQPLTGSVFGVGPADVEIEKAYAREIMLLIDERAIEPTAEAEIQAIKIGPGVFVGVPGELFASLGLRIKGSSKSMYTFIVELANGCVGYIPTPEAFGEGGYEVRTARSSKLIPEAGTMIADEAIELVNKIQ